MMSVSLPTYYHVIINLYSSSYREKNTRAPDPIGLISTTGLFVSMLPLQWWCPDLGDEQYLRSSGAMRQGPATTVPAPFRSVLTSQNLYHRRPWDRLTIHPGFPRLGAATTNWCHLFKRWNLKHEVLSLCCTDSMLFSWKLALWNWIKWS